MQQFAKHLQKRHSVAKMECRGLINVALSSVVVYNLFQQYGISYNILLYQSSAGEVTREIGY